VDESSPSLCGAEEEYGNEAFGFAADLADLSLRRAIRKGEADNMDDRLGDLIRIPAGSFLMGNAGDEGYGDPAEFPQHSVYVAEFRRMPRSTTTASPSRAPTRASRT